jgi:DNA-binding PucR family transcriptional regulator
MRAKGVEAHLGAAVEAVLRELADGIETDADDLADRFVANLHDEMPELPDSPAIMREERDSMRADILLFADMVRRGAPAQAVEAPAQSVEYVRASVQRGGSLSALMRTIRVGQDFTFEDWEERLAAMALPGDVMLATMRALRRYAFAWVDTFAEQLAEEYQRERERWLRGAQALRADMIRALVEGGPVDVDAASRALGHELRRHHVGLVLWGEPAEGETTALPALERAAAEISRALGCDRPLLFAAGSGLLWAWASSAAPIAPEALAGIPAAQVGPTRVSVAIGDPEQGVEGFRHTHRDAADASRIAMLAGRRAGTVTRFHAVDLAALVAGDLGRTRRFVRRELGALAADDDETSRLRATLKVYLEESSSRTATARRLGVHHNTVANRVQSCRDVLGRDLNERRVQLEVALALAQLLGPTVLGPQR